MPKRIVLCCDGTWNQRNSTSPTNVQRIYEAIANSDASDARNAGEWSQLTFYQEGVGTNWYDRLPGGAFGAGIDDKIKELYRYLAVKYQSGDEIYIFGFSRGAYTARSLGGLLHSAGLILGANEAQVEQAYKIYRIQDEDQRHAQADAFRLAENALRVPITLMACWDTVGALGIPRSLPFDRWLNQAYEFHNTNLSELIQHALHVVALDEQRRVFELTEMNTRAGAPTKLLQVWFVGTHENVGSSGGALADVTLDWMIKSIGAMGLGLQFNPDVVPADRVDLNTLAGRVIDQLRNIAQPPFNWFQLLGSRPREIVDVPVNAENLTRIFHPAVLQLWKNAGQNQYRPKAILESAWGKLFDR
jgi:uncharacterized protein (DUF2235 family)